MRQHVFNAPEQGKENSEIIMEALLDTIQRLKAEKESKNIVPVLIPFSELQRERIRLMRDELNILYKNKKIGIARLLNEIAIK